MNYHERLELQNSVKNIYVCLDEFFDDSISNSIFDCPFPNCEIMSHEYTTFFGPHPSTDRDVDLWSDKFLERADCYSSTFRVQLNPTDNWLTLVQKADKLAKISRDIHHDILESFCVVGNILIPNFCS